MKKVLVIGATGLVASRYVELADKEFEIVAVDEKTIDITDNGQVNQYFDKNKFDSVINFAAFTNVDSAELQKGDEDGMCYKLNVEGPRNLIEACKIHNIFLVHISTDFVFPGTETFPGPYAEDSVIPNNSAGIGWYGWTKNRAEYFINNDSVKSAIVRIAYPFYATDFDGKLDFAKTYLKLYDEGKIYPIFDDQIMSFLNVDDFIEPLNKIISDQLEGVFHIVSKNSTSPFEFVSYLLKKARGVESVLQKGSIKEFLRIPGKTPRPVFGGLKTEITQNKLGIEFKTWQEMIDEFVYKIKTK